MNLNRMKKQITKSLKKTAAISLAVVDNGQVVLEDYYGYINQTFKKNDVNSKMMVGSNGKIMTTIAIFQLFEQGLLDLDADITNYIENLRVISRFESKKITIRNILKHRSGLASDDFDFITSEKYVLSDIVDVVNRTPLSYEPGTLYAYSNIGYTLLGLIIQNISGVPFEEYVRVNIFDKLGTTFEYIKAGDDLKREDLSACFDSNLESSHEPLTNMTPAGTNLYGTLTDMIKLIKVFTNQDEQSLLKPETIELMTKKITIPDVIDGEIHHGLGLVFDQYNYYSEEVGHVICHGGDTMYHHSRFVFIPKLKLGFIVMTNSLNGLLTSIKLVDALMDQYMSAIGIKLAGYNCSSMTIADSINESVIGEYKGPRVDINVYQKNNDLYAKIRFLSMKLIMQDDGFYKVKPIGIAKLPPFSFLTKRLLLAFKEINGVNIVYGKEFYKYKYNAAKIAMKMSDTPETIAPKFIGEYQPILSNENLAKGVQKVSIKSEGNYVSLTINIIGSIQKVYLQKIDDTNYSIIGFGRYAGDIVQFDENESITLSVIGLNYRKVSTSSNKS